jgi:rhomboid protease GluP
MVPKELHASFWTPNGATPTEFSVSHFCKMACCPCCVGPCCSEQRRSDYYRLLRMLTVWLMVAQLVLYILTMSRTHHLAGYLEPDVGVLLDFGANSRCKVQCQHQYYRLLGYILLHGSIWHLLLNFLSEFLFVLPMEWAWGTIKFFVIYVVSGVLGGLVSDLRTGIVSVGASCSIFGVMGAHAILIVIMWHQLHELVKRPFLIQLMVLPILFIAVSFLPNVDWLGHLGRLIGGIAVGALIFIGKATEKKRKFFLLIGIGLIVAILVGSLCVINLTHTSSCDRKCPE